MNYSNIIEELENATLFDMYRLLHALDNELENPNKIKLIKNNLRVGQIISHYNNSMNILEDVEIIKLNKNRCLVKKLSDESLWNILYASINMDNADVNINTNQEYGLKKNQISIGEILKFLDNDNHQRYGKVIRLNQKSVTLLVNDEKWRVGYGLLGKHTDIDGVIIANDILLM